MENKKYILYLPCAYFIYLKVTGNLRVRRLIVENIKSYFPFYANEINVVRQDFTYF